MDRRLLKPHRAVVRGLGTAALLFSVLVGPLALLPRTDAAFSDVDLSSANLFASETLAPPSTLSVSGSRPLTLSWTATGSSFAAGYRVYRSAVSGGPFSLVADIAPLGVNSVVTDPGGGTHYYVARSYFLGWESVDSNEVVAVVAALEDFDAVPPAVDNCPDAFNVDQVDTDADGLGDVCDLTPTASSGLNFSTVSSYGSDNAYGIASGDFDGDGDADLVFSVFGGSNTIWFNNGLGVFSNSGQALGSGDFKRPQVGDADGDGDLDLLIPKVDAGSRLYLNNGSGTFFEFGQSFMIGSHGLALVDVDNDGDLDSLMSGDGAVPQLYLNNGGGFSTVTIGVAATDTRSLAFADFNSDEIVDVAIGRKSGDVIVLLQGPLGTYSDTGQTIDGDFTEAIVTGDLDGDGDEDLVVSNFLGSTQVWVNDGIGNFSELPQTFAWSNGLGIDLGDLDGDGDLDLVVATATDADEFWLNNGSGTFSDSGLDYGPEPSFGVELVDVDGDSDLDSVFATTGSDPFRIRFNN